ncbi:hypothetical protein VHEMI08556 [[Torrubiella] hemipterigena]|uniref:Fungal specific transcription factor n=1 Tax=[Torrubiella] hemipterigena TaxID=1531966 RepID=A0A0A1TND6_9HYPO|nr:hypothetical protein VHEMI08556 [[Torrubiella] hemipterigena]
MRRERGLGGSIWASETSSRRQSVAGDHRSRSVPPQSPNQPTFDLPKTSTSIAAPLPTKGALGPTQALQRFEQACQRLRWKFIDLEASYQRALVPQPHQFTPDDAERNFKIDFHEFYVWIEQAVVLLLHVFSIEIPRTSFLSDKDRRAGGSSSHAYHHNVLRCLDEVTNPLHEVLGKGDVNHALWKAKELRNRWKDAAEGRETPPLKMYDLRWIVRETLGGLEAAYTKAQQEVALVGGGREEEASWDWMVDDMDWEA